MHELGAPPREPLSNRRGVLGRETLTIQPLSPSSPNFISREFLSNHSFVLEFAPLNLDFLYPSPPFLAFNRCTVSAACTSQGLSSYPSRCSWVGISRPPPPVPPPLLCLFSATDSLPLIEPPTAVWSSFRTTAAFRGEHISIQPFPPQLLVP